MATKQIAAVAALVGIAQRRTAPALTHTGEQIGEAALLVDRPDALAPLTGLFGEDEIGLADCGGVIVLLGHHRDFDGRSGHRFFVYPIERRLAEGRAHFEIFLDCGL